MTELGAYRPEGERRSVRFQARLEDYRQAAATVKTRAPPAR
jgi:hypothetical protein